MVIQEIEDLLNEGREYPPYYYYWNYYYDPVGGEGSDGYPLIYPFIGYKEDYGGGDKKLESVFDKYEYTKGTTSYGNVSGVVK